MTSDIMVGTNLPDCISTTAKEEKRFVELEHVFNALGVTFESQIEATKSILRQRVGSTL